MNKLKMQIFEILDIICYKKSGDGKMNEKDKIITKFGTAKIGHHGYYQIKTRKEGNHGKYLHVIIWEDFYGKSKPEGYDIHHINGDKLDNRIQNLQCVEKSLHRSFHNKCKEKSEETKRKISKKLKEQWKDEKYLKKMRERDKKNSERITKYSLWDASYITYYKGAMFNGGRVPAPCKCFRYKYNGYVVPIGYFHDFVSCEIINDLVNDAIGGYD